MPPTFDFFSFLYFYFVWLFLAFFCCLEREYLPPIFVLDWSFGVLVLVAQVSLQLVLWRTMKHRFYLSIAIRKSSLDLKGVIDPVAGRW